ncbi:MAG: hypothetical protein GNW80_05930 [Asgard group archaeon]|nr:hypothetical protein [Asgard group archaeon]
MSSQDVITYKPAKMIFIKDEKKNKLFSDENLNYVLKFLRKGAMTIHDLSDNFKRIEEEKSDKSIYRYLHKLIQAKLVAKAGKRITTKNESDLISETLYMRTSNAFILKIPLAKKEKEDFHSPIFDSMYLLLKQQYGNKKIGKKAFKKFFDKIDNERDQYIMDLYEKADEETMNKLGDLEGKNILFALEYASWIAILLKYDIKMELEKIYSS